MLPPPEPRYEAATAADDRAFAVARAAIPMLTGTGGLY
jgi:hypothetical protein